MARRTVSALVCAAVLILCPGGLYAAGQEISVVRTFPREGETLVRLDFPVVVEFTGPADPEGFPFALSPDPGGWQEQWENGNRRVKLAPSGGGSRGTRYEARIKAEKGTNGRQYFFRFLVSAGEKLCTGGAWRPLRRPCELDLRETPSPEAK